MEININIGEEIIKEIIVTEDMSAKKNRLWEY